MYLRCGRTLAVKMQIYEKRCVIPLVVPVGKGNGKRKPATGGESGAGIMLVDLALLLFGMEFTVDFQ